MPDQDTSSTRFYVLGPREQAAGSIPQGVQSLDEALSVVADRQAEFIEETGPGRCFEIAREAPGSRIRPLRRARYHLFVDVNRTAVHGDGTELSPWSGLEPALEEMRLLHREGHLELRRGERIRLSHREIFSSTSLERRKKILDVLARVAFILVVAALVIPVLAVIFYLFYRAWPVLSLDFIFTNPENNMTAGGIWGPLVGTFYLIVVSLCIVAPIGILAAIYLNEYARDNWFTRTINLAVVNLAGVPSIVHGLFGFGAFVLFARMGTSVIAASCTLAVMSLPVIITSTREALGSVPMSFREACWNLGATRWQTIRTIVMPNSLSGILTGVILEICRSAGETAPILFTGAVFYYAGLSDEGLSYFFPYSLDGPFMCLQYHLFTLATQIRGVSEELQYGAAAVLIGLTLAINSVSISLRIYLRSRKKW